MPFLLSKIKKAPTSGALLIKEFIGISFEVYVAVSVVGKAIGGNDIFVVNRGRILNKDAGCGTVCDAAVTDSNIA